ncbi:MAG TPA: DoxX-like family protein [Pirellulaceae bacterium]|nr:DoxX-like family protein [Pirellulaceae bacterium]HMO93948.1 DoxX-like family protein [Pirellulaceae bacterium]HMP67954.1 DoxX-like family protein [Pirellulaceae bacterium]
MNRVYFLSRLSLAVIFFYHGLIPKLMFGDSQEVEMNEKFMPWLGREFALVSSGLLELAFAVVLLAWFRSRIPIYCVLVFAMVATMALLFGFPEYFTEAFNPFSINFSLVMFALINLASAHRVSEVDTSART